MLTYANKGTYLVKKLQKYANVIYKRSLIRNLIKLKGTAKLILQGEWVCLKNSKYILFEILAN